MKKEPRRDGKKKKSSYKLKRSFTRNKKTRAETGESLGSYQKKSFTKGEEKDTRDSKEKRRDRKSEFISKNSKFSKRNEKPFFKKKEGESDGRDKKPYRKDFSEKSRYDKNYSDKKKPFSKDSSEKPRYDKSYGDKKKPFRKDFSKDKPSKQTFAEQGLIRLNRYISNAGICSRREADELIATGCVTVNGKVVTELGYKVKSSDVVTYEGTHLKTEKHVYVLLNKPKDYITTSDDEKGRRTVMELIAGACKERVYPVGRLDRNTMGLLLFTNDGEMTKKLTHPKHLVQKLYHVELDKNLKQDDLEKIRAGVELEDGFIKPDEVAYAGETKREVGIMIHSGRNRIVRRIFEGLNYDVIRLDRVMFAGLTKKDLPRGRWRHLNEKEVAFLKML